jgi:hypothetical protein
MIGLPLLLIAGYIIIIVTAFHLFFRLVKAIESIANSFEKHTRDK